MLGAYGSRYDKFLEINDVLLMLILDKKYSEMEQMKYAGQVHVTA